MYKGHKVVAVTEVLPFVRYTYTTDDSPPKDGQRLLGHMFPLVDIEKTPVIAPLRPNSSPKTFDLAKMSVECCY